MKCAIGFDAYIDKIARVVKERTDEEHFEFYSQIEDYGSRILKMKGLSGDIEIFTESIRYGGNAPLMAGALASLGADVSLIAPAGDNPCYDLLKEKTKLINIGNPAESTNLEFNDGKVMMGENNILSEVNIDNLSKKGFLDDILKAFNESELMGFVNWSQMEKILPVYKYILDNIDDSNRVLFMDMADFSKKPAEKITEFLNTVSVNKKGLTAIIGLNENELNLMAAYAGVKKTDDIKEYALKVSEAISLNVVVHGMDYSVFVKEGQIFYAEGKLVKKPKLSTGGGDHFNAGFCYALLKKTEEEKALRFAMGTSGAYITDGVSPCEERVYEYLKENN